MKKLLTYCIFPIIIIVLGFLLYSSIMQPVRFNKESKRRQTVAIEQMKSIRTLQVAFKDANGHYAPVMDTLIDFYNNGEITIMKQIGSYDDSIQEAHTKALTAAIQKANRGIKKAQIAEKLYQLHEAGDNQIVVQLPIKVAVKDTLLKNIANFNPESLRTIPFSDGDTVIMKTIVKQVSGVDVPLFEAQMPFNSLLKGMDHQLLVNLNAERTDTDRYPGLMVGSVDAANNNAGNWE